ncbi:TIGR02444 family protein [Nitratireductor sp. GCM10026969]|uniref:TIGR02444 family protein n=1 Tax=Nitratireductor sp. GCM10026969 TaxID=3252645 RepID=UPI00361896D4
MAPHPFWTFSLDRYGRDGVAPLCLELQERHWADVNLVLFALWLGRDGRGLDAEGAARAAEAVAEWHLHVVRPMRGVRRWLKNRAIEDRAARDRLRAAVQKYEIEAERMEQDMLFALAPMVAADLPDATDPATTMARNAAHFCTPRGDSAPEATLARLATLCL